MVLAAILVAGSTAAGAASADQACPFESRVFCAIQDNDADGLSAALDGGASPNVVGQGATNKGMTPLSYAINGTANPRIIAALLDKGADPNVADPVARGGFTPLAHAASLGKVRIVGLLLQHGADPDLTGNDFSPLMWAAEGPDGSPQQGPRNGQTQQAIAKLLIAGGADVNYAIPASSPIGTGQRAIDRAIWVGDVPMVRQLIAAGAQMPPKHEDLARFSLDWTLLQWAVTGRHPEMLRFLLSLPRSLSVGSVAGALKHVGEELNEVEEYEGAHSDSPPDPQPRQVIAEMRAILEAAQTEGRQ